MSSTIRVNSTDSIHTVKLKIMEQMDLVPSRQKLMYNKEHLSNDDWTLAAYEIPPKSDPFVNLHCFSIITKGNLHLKEQIASRTKRLERSHRACRETPVRRRFQGNQSTEFFEATTRKSCQLLALRMWLQ